MAQRKPVKRRSMGGVVALVILGLVVAAPLVMQSGVGGGAQMPVAQPMELRGHWLGMGLAPADSTTARQLGVPAAVTGVVVAELPNPGASRAAQGGVQIGDVIVRLDGSAVSDLSTLYTLSTRLDVARPLSVEIMRGGQPMVVTLPGPPAPPPGAMGGGVAGPMAQPGVTPGAIAPTPPVAPAPRAAVPPMPAVQGAPVAGVAPGQPWGSPAAPMNPTPQSAGW
jgi:serine protease Do